MYVHIVSLMIGGWIIEVLCYVVCIQDKAEEIVLEAVSDAKEHLYRNGFTDSNHTQGDPWQDGDRGTSHQVCVTYLYFMLEGFL